MDNINKLRKRCAIYGRKSTNEPMEKKITSTEAQCEACELYINSQKYEGWELVNKQYNDNGFSGSNMERPALKELLNDIEDRKIDCVVVYKHDRLTRSLLDFSKLVEFFDQYDVSFVSVNENFNTSDFIRASLYEYAFQLCSIRKRDWRRAYS